MHPVHTIVLDLDNPLVLNVPAIRRHKTFASHVPYLLLVHIVKLFVNYFLPFCTKICIWMIPRFVESFGFFRYRLGFAGYHGQIDKEILVFNGTFFSWSMFDDFVGIIILGSLEFFYFSYHFYIDSGLGGCFDLVVDVFINEVFAVIFNVIITFITVGITMFTLLLSLLLIPECFEFLPIIPPFITHSHQDRFLNLGILSLELL